MTVRELIEVLKQRPSESNVCISVKGNTYVVGKVVTILGGVVTIHGSNWELVNEDVAIVGR